MDDLKTYGLAAFSLVFSSFDEINPFLQSIVLILTVCTLILKAYKDIKDINK
jgi:hypothetical protein